MSRNNLSDKAPPDFMPNDAQHKAEIRRGLTFVGTVPRSAE
jgi:hypothetical protein